MAKNGTIISELIRAISVVLAALIPSIIAITHKRKKKKLENSKVKSAQNRVLTDSKIQGLLGVLLNCTNADRAYIYRFHPKENPKYFSCAYEQVAPGVSSEINNRQLLILNEHPIFLEYLNSDSAECYDINKIVDEQLGKLLRVQGVVNFYIYPIKNNFKNIIGFVGLDYIHNLQIKDISLLTIALDNFAFQVSDEIINYEE